MPTESSIRNSKATLAQSLDRPGVVEAATQRIAEIADAADYGNACMRLQELARMLGCQSAAFATFMEDDPWHQTYRFLLACHPAWCAQYQRLAWFADDPWLNYARKHNQPARSTEIPVESDQQRVVVELAKVHGIASALIVPSPSSGGLTRLGVLMLGTDTPDYFNSQAYPRLKVLARALSAELLDWLTTAIRNELRSAANLSDADLELLRAERAGLSSKAIGRATQTSETSVDSRFQRIIAKLKVPSRKAAAQMAAENGLI
jgi:DNA-binding CsgD family transcriptional regulator